MISCESPSNILVLDNVTVDYGRNLGLDRVSLTVKQGEIHAILGDNGAGKSTLVKLISGAVPLSSGNVFFENQPLKTHSTFKAIKLGIGTVYQELDVLPDMTAYENIFLIKKLKKLGIFNSRKLMREKAHELLQELSTENIDIDAPLRFYKVAQQKMVEIARGMFCATKLLVIDEFSVNFSQEDIERFHYLLSVLRQRGITVIYVTHNMDRIFNFASRVTILKNGRIVETSEISDVDKIQLVQLTYSFMYSRKALEEKNFELFYLKNFNESILNTLPLPFLVTDTKGHILVLNDQVTTLFHIERKDYLQRHFSELIHLPEHIVSDIENANPLVEKLQTYQIHLNTLPEQRDIRISVLPFHDEEGAFLGNILIFDRNVEISQSSDPSLQASQNIVHIEKNVFEVAHEIHNPLNIILNYLTLVKTSDSLQEVRENIGCIEKEVKRIKHILQKVLRFAEKQEQEKGCVKHVNLSSIFEEVFELVRPTIDTQRIQLNVTVKDDVSLQIDPDLFKQVILNLLLNGIEAMPDGGSLDIWYHEETRDDSVYAVLAFQDTGIGIAEHDLKHIFEPFFSTKPGEGAKGLGLSLSQDIVSQFGGHIAVESQLHHGATFFVFLPQCYPNG